MRNRLISRLLFAAGVLMGLYLAWNQYLVASVSDSGKGGAENTWLCTAVGVRSAVACQQLTWLQVVAVAAAALAAIVAVVALRHRGLEGRAGIILKIGERWRELIEERELFSKALKQCRNTVIDGEGKNVNEKGREPLFRKACTDYLVRLDAMEEPARKEIRKLIAYFSWFETVGMLVKRGYLPLGEIVALYKGPILNADIFFSGFIEQWQARPNVALGLYENALYLARWVRWYEKFWLLRWAERAW